jgi:hypothetical protein
MAKSSVKAGLRLLEENYTEAGVDCYFIRAPLFRQGRLCGLRMSEGNPPARPEAEANRNYSGELISLL